MYLFVVWVNNFTIAMGRSHQNCVSWRSTMPRLILVVPLLWRLGSPISPMNLANVSQWLYRRRDDYSLPPQNLCEGSLTRPMTCLHRVLYLVITTFDLVSRLRPSICFSSILALESLILPKTWLDIQQCLCTWWTLNEGYYKKYILQLQYCFCLAWECLGVKYIYYICDLSFLLSLI